MFAERIAAAIEAADFAHLDQLSGTIWSAWGAGTIGDADAQRLTETVAARKMAGKASNVIAGGFRQAGAAFTPTRPRRVHRRPEIMARRRRLAAAGPLPPALAAAFTLGEQAVMRVIGNEIRQHGICDRSIGELAARAACSARTVQRALRAAALLGLIIVQERRRRGQKSLTNVVRAISPAWLDWLAKSASSERDRAPKLADQGYKSANLTVHKTSFRPRPSTKSLIEAPSRQVARVWR